MEQVEPKSNTTRNGKMEVIGERTKNFSARIVHLGMWLWQVVQMRKPVRVYNHWLVSIDGIRYETSARGVIANKRELAKDHVIYSFPGHDPKVELYLLKQLGKKYEYSNFLFHALRIIFPAWLGSRTDEKHSCVELVTRTLTASGYHIKIWSNPVELKAWMDSRDE